MINISYHRDDQGRSRVIVQSPYELLGQYLQSDIQSIPSRCLELIKAVNKVQEGQVREWEDTGNTFELRVIKDKVYIKHLYLEDIKPIHLPLEDFRKALEEWLKFIEKK